jgi:hypothetical protein
MMFRLPRGGFAIGIEDEAVAADPGVRAELIRAYLAPVRRVHAARMAAEHADPWAGVARGLAEDPDPWAGVAEAMSRSWP